MTVSLDSDTELCTWRQAVCADGCSCVCVQCPRTELHGAGAWGQQLLGAGGRGEQLHGVCGVLTYLLCERILTTVVEGLGSKCSEVRFPEQLRASPANKSAQTVP